MNRSNGNNISKNLLNIYRFQFLFKEFLFKDNPRVLKFEPDSVLSPTTVISPRGLHSRKYTVGHKAV